MGTNRMRCFNRRLSTLLLVLIGSVITISSASAQVYRWVDEKGRTIVSDSPPPGVSTKKIGKAIQREESNLSKPAENDSPASLDPEVAQKVREKEKAEKEANEKRQKAIAEYCASASERLAQLQSGERIGLRDKSGERSFMSDQQRAEEISKLRSNMAEQKCGN